VTRCGCEVGVKPRGTMESSARSSTRPTGTRFGRELMSVPGCEALEHCIQCGTCSGVCPLSIYMDYTRARSWNWCARTSRTRCSRATHLAVRLLLRVHHGMPAPNPHHDIMYELKQRAIKSGLSETVPDPGAAEEFTKMVHDTVGSPRPGWSPNVHAHQPLGRTGHGRTRNWIDEDRPLLPQAGQIERRKDLATIMEAVDNSDGKAKA